MSTSARERLVALLADLPPEGDQEHVDFQEMYDDMDDNTRGRLTSPDTNILASKWPSVAGRMIRRVLGDVQSAINHHCRPRQ